MLSTDLQQLVTVQLLHCHRCAYVDRDNDCRFEDGQLGKDTERFHTVSINC